MDTVKELKPIEMDLDTWKTRLDSELERIVALIIENYHPQKIILFGSLANRQQRLWSDIDLVVIHETNDRFIDRSKDWLPLLMPQVGLDLLIYTPSEFEELCQERTFFKEDIIEKGQVLYERPN
ncbi:MAG: hypothetical protein MAG431_01997 [Chloroflexi bacterium]|nr:hypothetical protein [Chloroflexota bacterium]